MAPFIAIVGLYTSGKTSLARIIGESLGFDVFLEEHQSRPYHMDFSQDMLKWAFQNQVDFITAAAETQRHINQFEKFSCLDGCIYEYFHVFTGYLHDHGYLSDRDFIMIQRLYNLLEDVLVPPDLLVVLDVSPSTALSRMKQRSRLSDQSIGVNLELLKEIHGRLEKWIGMWPPSKLIRIDTDRLNFVKDARARQSTLKVLQTCLSEKNLISKPISGSDLS
jgi:deoxyadenosine/deoxycytidine kinase